MTTTRESVLSPDEIRPAAEMCRHILEQLDRILLGQEELHRMVLAGLLSRGHILLEGLPGLGKTAMVKAISQILRLDFRRIQFTPDLMPSDIVGAHILQQTPAGSREMTFRPGPVFTNILLADEINRASPKTQSALLEAMQEHCVTLLGETRPLPEPFFVLASQNPIELEGTYPLPEAQLDRFLFRVLVSGINADTMTEIIHTRRRGEPPTPSWTMDAEQLQSLFAVMDRIHLPKPVARFISRVAAATHPDADEAPEIVRNYVTYGASPRAAIAIAEAARAHALIAGRPTTGFEDARAVAEPALNHRIILNYRARFDHVSTIDVIRELGESLSDVNLDLPSEVTVEGASE